MLGIDCSVEVTPFEEGKWRLGHSSVDRLPILCVPDYKGVVLADAREELVVWRKLQFQHLVLDPAKDCHGSFVLHVPQDDGRIWGSLENCALLSSSDDLTRVRDSDG